MPRSTAETLKQIQKQGLSISIIGGDNSASFPLETAAKETKDKQNAVANENTVSTSRTATTPEIISVVSQVRQTCTPSVDTKTSSVQSQNQIGQQSFSKQLSPQSSTSVETKLQNSQRTNTPTSAENKNQFSVSNRVQIDKNQTNAARLSQSSSVPDKCVTRNGQNVSNLIDKTPDVKNQVSHSRALNQSSLLNSSQLETKTLNAQSRIGQNCSSPVPEKNIGIQRGQIHISEIKSSNPVKIVSARVNVNRTAPIGKTFQNVKVSSSPITSQVNIIKSAPNIINNIKQVEKLTNSVTERSLNNPFRVASAKVGLEDKTSKASRSASYLLENQSKITQSTKLENKITQGVKISELSSELHQKPLLSPGFRGLHYLSDQDFDENSSEAVSPNVTEMPTNQKAGVKRGNLSASTPVKRKTMKFATFISEQSGSQSDVNLSSDESPEKEKKLFNIAKLTPGLTITPVQKAIPSTSGTAKKESNPNLAVICTNCTNLSLNMNVCDGCHQKISPAAVRCNVQSAQPNTSPILVTQNVTIEKSMRIVYLPTVPGQSQSFQFEQPQKVLVSPRRGRPKKRFSEPVCYTLSSDDDEISYEHMQEEGNDDQLLYPDESEENKSEHSSNSENMPDESFEEEEYPGVTSINTRPLNNQDDEEEEEEEEEEDLEQEMMSEEELLDENEMNEDFYEEDFEDEVPPDEENEEKALIFQRYNLASHIVLKCRSIRIGSYKIHPEPNFTNIDVIIKEKSIHFTAPVIDSEKKQAQIVLRSTEIHRTSAHFGKCLPIMFVFTSKALGEVIRRTLNMTKTNILLYDPTTEDMRRNKITFLIDVINDEQRMFMRQVFPGQELLKEIDQKEANEILVKSTPNASQTSTLRKIETPPVSNSPTSTTSLPPHGILSNTLSTPQSLSITKIIVPKPVVPVTKILTYPPPPLTGGVAINTADLATLEEGEFLNDAILDFYLKYVYYERLPKHDKEKTHIFSSFFYPRLTQKPDRLRAGDDAPKTMQVRRHNQVKTWTKHVDIFSKDYIIIPVNQHNHWFLAFVCYPGRVTDIPATDNVTSTNDQESSKVTVKEDNVNTEDAQNQDENSVNSNSLYEVEEPPDSDEEASSEIPDSSTHPDSNVIIHDTSHPRKETPCILIFDSLSGPNRWRIASTLREYLEIEWRNRKGTKKVFDRNTMQGFIVKCPQQTNFSDCGLYVLQYVESFFENPIPYFGNPMPDLTNWFSEAKISQKRQQIKELILNLQKKYQPKQPSGITVRKINTSTVSSVTASPQAENR